MKILVLNPPNIPFTDKDILMPQIDLLQEAALLESIGHEVIFYDMDAEWATKEDLKKIINKNNIDATYMLFDEIVQIHSHKAFEKSLDLGIMIREQGVKSVIGGTIPSQFHKKILERGAADVVLIGPPGPALKELFSATFKNLKNLKRVAYKKNMQIFAPDIYSDSLLRNFKLGDSYKVAARHLVNEDNYPIDVRSIATSRGCRPKGTGCTFCPYTAFWGWYRTLPLEDVFDDIGNILSSGINKIIFLDSTFSYNKKHIMAVAEGIINRGYHKRLTWGGLSRVDIDLSILPKLIESGMSWIHFGVESGDQNTLDKLRKNISISQIENAFHAAKKLGLRTRASLIIDAGETKSSIDKTIDLVQRIKPNELKPHFLSSRVYSKMGIKITMENQSIFGDNSINENEVKRYAKNKLEELAKELQSIGYAICLDSQAKPGFWKEVWRRGEVGDSANFLCVGPARYGIAWKKINQSPP